MKLTWSPRARGDIEAIYDWIAPRDKRAATTIISEIRKTGELLSQFPGIGRETNAPTFASCRSSAFRISCTLQSCPAKWSSSIFATVPAQSQIRASYSLRRLNDQDQRPSQEVDE